MLPKNFNLKRNVAFTIYLQNTHSAYERTWNCINIENINEVATHIITWLNILMSKTFLHIVYFENIVCVRPLVHFYGGLSIDVIKIQ